MREADRERQELMDEQTPPLEKHDSFTMWVSGMLVIGLPCLVLILIIVGVTMLLFAR